MNKKLLNLLLIPVLLASCSKSNNDSESHSASDEGNYIIKEDVDITFMTLLYGDYYEKLQDRIDEFMKVEPHVKVNLSNPVGAGKYAALEKYVVAGFFKEDYPDIAQCYPDNVLKYMSHDKVVKLDDYLLNDDYGIIDAEGESDYIRSFLDEGRGYTKEGTYSLPFCKSTELLYYNKDVLEGLDLTSIDNTINEGRPLDANYLNSLTWHELFEKLCPAIEIYNRDVKTIMNMTNNTTIFTYDSDENFFITLADQYGYGYTSKDEDGYGSIDFDNDGMKNLMRMLNTAAKVIKDEQGNITKMSYLKTYGTNNFKYVSSLFTNKETLFTLSSTAGFDYNFSNSFELGVARIPHAENREYSCINQGPSICILDHDDENRTLASYLLWRYLTDEENALEWSLYTGYMCIRDSSYESETYNAALNVGDDAASYDKAKAAHLNKVAEVKDFMFNTPLFKGSGNARTNVGQLIIDCILSEDLESEIDELFKSYSDEAKEHLAVKPNGDNI
ncbi:MAG: extracellular solute-binding protein [Bacilli bacterium]|nr:extracellular solute-binding protein [Bacilli bacterium]